MNGIQFEPLYVGAVDSRQEVSKVEMSLGELPKAKKVFKPRNPEAIMFERHRFRTIDIHFQIKLAHWKLAFSIYNHTQTKINKDYLDVFIIG